MKTDQIQTFAIRDTESGIRAVVGNIGAAVFSLEVPLPDGGRRDVVLGFEDPEEYRVNELFIGATVGPHANRIGGASFSLNGKTYILDKNDGENNLHSGRGLQFSMWDVTAVSDSSVTFSADCADGENGFPGPIHIDVTYTIQDRALVIDYHGRAEQDTVFNPTNHSYFNLKGQGNGDIMDHLLVIYAENITPAGPGAVPDGTILEVDGTPFDFQLSEVIGARIEELLTTPEIGYDHNYILEKEEIFRVPEYDIHGLSLYCAARVTDPEGEVTLDVITDRPGLQFYTGNYLNVDRKGKGGVSYPARSAFCLETQYYPNAVNIPAFPQPVIRAGEDVYSRTVYRF